MGNKIEKANWEKISDPEVGMYSKSLLLSSGCCEEDGQ